MKIQSGGREFSLCFMTATWMADLDHFRWLRRSLEHAGLAHVPHVVVVQTEDLPLFRPWQRGAVRVVSTADVLPGDIEQRRVLAMRRARLLGSRMTKLCTSLNKRLGWFDWVRFLGWQIQQITKLQFPGLFPYDVVVVLDSDVLITRGFDLQLFVRDGHVAAFEKCYVTPRTPGLAWRWYVSACALFGHTPAEKDPVNGYVGTPFVFDRATVIALQRRLESEHGRPWHATLLSLPVSSWSEFSIYNVYVRLALSEHPVRLTANPHVAGLDNAQDSVNAEAIIRGAFADPGIYFFGIPSARFARGRWSLQQLDALLLELTGHRAGVPPA